MGRQYDAEIRAFMMLFAMARLPPATSVVEFR
jgi:hypothetical protein